MIANDPLVEAKERLDTAAEKLNRYITKTEDLLRELTVCDASIEMEAEGRVAVPISGSVKLPTNQESEPYTTLSWRRHKKEWKLCVVIALGPECDDEVIPLLNASLARRIMAAKHFDALVEALVQRANKIAMKIEEILPDQA